MPKNEDDEYAQGKTWEFLRSLTNLTEVERQEARYVFSRLYDAVNSNAIHTTWEKINRKEIRADVLSSAAALLTVYLKEFIASVEDRLDDPPSEFRR